MLLRSERESGFTLVELMIAIAIIGILAAVALPAYQDYVKRGRIAEPVSALSDMRVKMEQYYQDNRSYTVAGAGDSCGTPGSSIAPKPVDTDFWTYTCPTKSSDEYVVQADGKGSMAGFKYTIDQDNTRSTVTVGSGWSGAPKNCWILNKGGGC